MKNVTPKAGQIWECDVIGGMSTRKIRTVIYNKPYHHDVFFECGNHMNTRDLWGCGTFIPQSDLEWLAVKVESLGSNIKFIARRGSEYLIFETKLEHTPGLYTSQEHQNMRYELGLDDRDLGEKMADGIADMLRSGEITVNNGEFKYNKKETKMIDLSPFEIGDKFDWIGNDLKGVAELVYISVRGHYVFDCPVDSEDKNAVIIVVDDNGHSAYDNFHHQFTKHDPRHWLSKLPDAGLFEFDWLAVECEESSIWHGYAKEPLMSNDGTFYNTNGMFSLMPIQGIKMPKLTGDEWKLSKISIVDLRAWQEQNSD